MSGFRDHFSESSPEYAQFRPRYPKALFRFLAEQSKGTDCAWDCGTGSGQAAWELAGHFQTVLASDPSITQVQNAVARAGIRYFAATAEATPIRDRSLDLIVVAQALHWFDLQRFFSEANRVLKPGGVLATWCYGLMRIDSPVDRLIERYCYETVGPYWPVERQQVERGYRTIDFPFAEMAVPELAMTAEWDLYAVVGYLGTWTATRRYREARGRDPLPILHAELQSLWGDSRFPRTIRWPLGFRVGRSVVSPRGGC